MALACPVVEWSRGRLTPAGAERKAPGETIRIEHDISIDADCDLVGIAIGSSVWAIDPDGDDGAMILSQPSTAGLVTSTAIAAGTDGVVYTLHNTVSLSDSTVLIYSTSIAVHETRLPTA